MNRNVDPLESYLRRFRPRPMSSAARRRIEWRLRNTDGGVLSRAREASRSRRPWLIGLSAAAILLVLLGVGFWRMSAHNEGLPLIVATRKPVQEQPWDAYHLVSAETVWVDQRDEGTCVHPDGGAARKIRVRCVDNLEWHNPRRGQTFRMTSPREEVRFVSLETY